VKGIVIYDSSFGNTKKVAETIAESLKDAGLDVDLLHVKDAKLSGKRYDFLILGSPTKFGTMTFTVRFFFGSVKSEEWANKPFATFDTENPDNPDRYSAALKMAERLREKKMSEVVPALRAIVIGQKGPLKDGEVERIKGWARGLAAKLGEAAPPQ